MKKKILTCICAIISCVLCLCVVTGLSGCGKVNLLEENIVDDNYDNYYEIFVYSFYDSDGDGYGDLNGVTQKLDYIRDMGYTGIWLMPIMPAASYHGYDVTDYYGIRSQYGTLDDYKNLLTEAHNRGIKIIIDLVVNHTSSQHPWFKAALSYRGGSNNPDEAKYIKYYNWSSVSQAGYVQNGNNSYYEAQFDSGMPDLNLSGEEVREELENVIKFWLEMGTDGFRLDGCLYYYSGQAQSIEFCKWIKDTASKYDENAYIVGEAWVSTKSATADFYTSGCDSFFYFPASFASGPTSCPIFSSLSTGTAATYWSSLNTIIQAAGGNIPAPFLSNHDIARSAGYLGKNADKIKFAYGLLSMYNGNTFTYYGDEIGMIGSQNDPDKRIGMLWDNKQTNMTRVPPGSSTQEYVFDGVKEQLKDSGSILNYYKVCNNARNAFPAIMRGTPSRIALDFTDVLAFKKVYGGETVTIVINFSTEKRTVEIEGTLAQGICVSGSVKAGAGSLTMPGYSIAILT